MVFLCVLMILALFCGCAPKQASSAGDGALPMRIVSLVPSVTEILFAIGAGDRVVGVTEYCDYPAEAQMRTSVGGFSGATLSMERIYALEPDLVFVSGDMHGRVMSMLDELGLASFPVEPRNFSQAYEVIAIIGEMTGCAEGAKVVVEEMRRKIGLIEQRISGRAQPRVFWLLGVDPLMSAGAGTFVSEAIQLGGGRNIFGDLNEDWPQISLEQVVLRNPDWILAGNDMGELKLSGDIWQLIPAVREGRVAFFNADILYRYGPRLADGVDVLAKILHPLDKGSSGE